MSNKGKLFLIPNTLGSDSLKYTIPEGIAERLQNLSLVFTEHDKAARKQLIALGFKERLDQIELLSIKNDLSNEDKRILESELSAGKDVGILSDAGLPAIADPGYQIVALAHTLGAQVVPLVGPSSIFLALMASGFNGQQFGFHGYLPKDQDKRIHKIKNLEGELYKRSQTQIFIETPYRNQYLFNDLLSTCLKNTKICLAVDLTTDHEWIKVHTVENWKKIKVDITKKQCIFLMYK